MTISGPLALIVGFFCSILLAYAGRLALLGPVHEARVRREQATVLLGRFPMEAFHWFMRQLARSMVRLKLNPDIITYAALLVTALTVPLLMVGEFAWGALALLIGSAFDALDGIVARQLGVASDSGEMLDAVVDRYADAMPLAGLMLYYRASAPTLLVLMLAWVGCFSVSYVRAKAEAMSLSLRGGLMRRHERLFYLGLALLVGPMVPRLSGLPIAQPLTPLILTGIAVLSNIAAVQLTLRARQALVAAARAQPGPAKGTTDGQ